eukprot:scaffold11620_cov119-Isochrysis_galbana.AAC.3
MGRRGRRGRRQARGLLLVGNYLLANGFGVGKDGGPGEALGVVLHIGSGASGGTAILSAINGGGSGGAFVELACEVVVWMEVW